MRTKKEILNDFKKLGCEVKEVEDQIFMTTRVKDKYWLDIEINTDILFVYVYSAGIDFVFIPLLNELLECIKENNMRTEEQVLKDFEELGYDRIENTDEYLKLYKHDFIVELSKFYRCYKSYWEHSTLKIRWTINIDMQEHKLLHELFEIWGWI